MAGGVALPDLLALLIPIPVAVLANLAVGRSWAVAAVRGLIAGPAAAVILLGLLDLSPLGATINNGLGLGLGTLATGLLTLLLLWRQVRRRRAAVIPIEPDHPVHVLALTLACLLLGVQLSQQLFSDVLGHEATSGQPLTPADVVLQEVPFLLLAFAGVGILVRRGPRESLARLGLVRPSVWQVLIGLAAAAAFFAFGFGMDQLSQRLTPDLAHRVEAANSRLFGGLAYPLGMATIALAPGLCEEGLLRGALQPRLGLGLTSLLFTAFHTQYGLSLDTVTVLLLALGLGLIRRLTNTTTAVLTHVGFNGIQAVGIGTLLGWQLMVESAAVLAVFALVASRSRPRLAGSS